MIQAVLNHFSHNLFKGCVFHEFEFDVFSGLGRVHDQKRVAAQGFAHGGKPERNHLTNIGGQLKKPFRRAAFEFQFEFGDRFGDIASFDITDVEVERHRTAVVEFRRSRSPLNIRAKDRLQTLRPRTPYQPTKSFIFNDGNGGLLARDWAIPFHPHWDSAHSRVRQQHALHVGAADFRYAMRHTLLAEFMIRRVEIDRHKLFRLRTPKVRLLIGGRSLTLSSCSGPMVAFSSISRFFGIVVSRSSTRQLCVKVPEGILQLSCHSAATRKRGSPSSSDGDDLVSARAIVFLSLRASSLCPNPRFSSFASLSLKTGMYVMIIRPCSRLIWFSNIPCSLRIELAVISMTSNQVHGRSASQSPIAFNDGQRGASLQIDDSH